MKKKKLGFINNQLGTEIFCIHYYVCALIP